MAEPHRLDAQVRFLRERPAVGVVGSSIRVINPDGATYGFRAYPRGHADIADAMRRYNAIAQPTVMARKSVIRAAGGFHTDWRVALDYDLWCRLAKGGVQFANMSEPLVRYRIHPEGSKSAQLRRTLRETLAIKEKHWGKRRGVRLFARAAVERLLLMIPASFVLRLFLWSQYRKTPPPGSEAA